MDEHGAAARAKVRTAAAAALQLAAAKGAAW